MQPTRVPGITEPVPALEAGRMDREAQANEALKNRYRAEAQAKAEFATPTASNQNLPAGVDEYQFAKSQGFPGSYQDWLKVKADAQRAPVAPPKPPDLSFEEQTYADWIKNPPKGYAADRTGFAKWKKENIGGGADAGEPLSDAALNMAAEYYIKTGQMPAFGMGGADSRKKILNRAGAMSAGTDVATNQASYKADQASLSKLQQQADAVNAFETTASKNLNNFIAQASKIVDTGSPWINTPIRAVNRSLLGNQDIPAYEAARTVALTEISRVVSNPNLTGVLSDQARQEISSLTPENATLSQILRVATVLTQDMANRKQSIDDQLEFVRGRIRSTPASSLPVNGAPPKPPSLATPFTASSSTDAPPVSMLKEGIHTTFKNGQTWTLRNGKPEQVTTGGK